MVLTTDLKCRSNITHGKASLDAGCLIVRTNRLGKQRQLKKARAYEIGTSECHKAPDPAPAPDWGSKI